MSEGQVLREVPWVVVDDRRSAWEHSLVVEQDSLVEEQHSLVVVVVEVVKSAVVQQSLR